MPADRSSTSAEAHRADGPGVSGPGATNAATAQHLVFATPDTLKQGKLGNARPARPKELLTLRHFCHAVDAWKSTVQYLTHPGVKAMPIREFKFDSRVPFMDRVKHICRVSGFGVDEKVLGIEQSLVENDKVKICMICLYDGAPRESHGRDIRAYSIYDAHRSMEAHCNTKHHIHIVAELLRVSVDSLRTIVRCDVCRKELNGPQGHSLEAHMEKYHPPPPSEDEPEADEDHPVRPPDVGAAPMPQPQPQPLQPNLPLAGGLPAGAHTLTRGAIAPQMRRSNLQREPIVGQPAHIHDPSLHRADPDQPAPPVAQQAPWSVASASAVNPSTDIVWQEVTRLTMNALLLCIPTTSTHAPRLSHYTWAPGGTLPLYDVQRTRTFMGLTTPEDLVQLNSHTILLPPTFRKIIAMTTSPDRRIFKFYYEGPPGTALPPYDIQSMERDMAQARLPDVQMNPLPHSRVITQVAVSHSARIVTVQFDVPVSKFEFCHALSTTYEPWWKISWDLLYQAYRGDARTHCAEIQQLRTRLAQLEQMAAPQPVAIPPQN
ncbi:hypothetical protein BC629DRAFT_1589302 [Irpex lacteus]|nr:hypothetical protein BC629DRAFT_1589302 [Irpex lacteus]